MVSLVIEISPGACNVMLPVADVMDEVPAMPIVLPAPPLPTVPPSKPLAGIPPL